MIIDIVSLILILAVVGFVLTQLFFVSNGKSSIPFLVSSSKAVNTLLDSGLIKENSKVIDLGSGIGDVVLRIAKIPGVEVTGIEINPTLHIIASIRKQLSKSPNISLKRDDILKQNLTEYDVIYIFGVTSFIENHLTSKLEKEAKHATIISNTFRISSKMFHEEELEIPDAGFNNRIYVYRSAAS